MNGQVFHSAMWYSLNQVSEYGRGQIEVCSAIEVTVSSILCSQKPRSNISSTCCSSILVRIKFNGLYLVWSVSVQHVLVFSLVCVRSRRFGVLSVYLKSSAQEVLQ